MSKSSLADLGQYNEMANGPLAALALKSREALMRQQQIRQGLIGQVTTNQPIGDVSIDKPRVAVNVGQPSIAEMTVQPIARAQAKPDPRAAFAAEMHKMFTPVEQGGALITSATPVAMVGGSLPEGHGWTNVPQRIRDRAHLPDGVKAIGFHPARMNDTQYKALDWFNQQRDVERQSEAEQSAATAAK